MKKRALSSISLPFTWGDLLSRDRLTALARHFYHRFIKIRGRAEDIAWGVSIGLFIGLTPTFGVQMYIAIFIASILKKNKITAAVRVWITNPITIPLFYGLTYYLGAKILGYPLRPSLFLHFSLETFRTSGKSVFISLWVGGVMAGLVAAVIGYFVTLQVMLSGKRKAERLGGRSRKSRPPRSRVIPPDRKGKPEKG